MKLLIYVAIKPQSLHALDIAGARTKAQTVEHMQDALVFR